VDNFKAEALKSEDFLKDPSGFGYRFWGAIFDRVKGDA